MESAPAMCPASNSGCGRTSRRTTLPARTRAASSSKLIDSRDSRSPRYAFTGQAVLDVEPVFAGFHQPRFFEHLKVRRGVSHRHLQLVGERLDRAWRLREQIQNLDAMRARQ